MLSHDTGSHFRHYVDKVLGGQKILLVDRNRHEIFELMDMLENRGAYFVTAQDHDQAFDKLKTHPDVNLMMVSMTMQHHEGFETIKKIHHSQKFHELPIVAITSHACTEAPELAEKLGIPHYIPKPVQEEHVIPTLRAVVRECYQH